jgi:ligand-binding sensor domain-containing protein
MKIALKILLFTILLAAVPASELSARENHIRFNHLTIRQGLSSNSVTGIVQDDQGFMWFGSYDGLNRYDGNEFRVYRHDPDNPNSLSSNPMRVLYKDRSGDLWIGTEGGGLNRFDRETETFTRYQHDPHNPRSLSHNKVRAIYEDRAGGIVGKRQSRC